MSKIHLTCSDSGCRTMLHRYYAPSLLTH